MHTYLSYNGNVHCTSLERIEVVINFWSLSVSACSLYEGGAWERWGMELEGRRCEGVERKSRLLANLLCEFHSVEVIESTLTQLVTGLFSDEHTRRL